MSSKLGSRQDNQKNTHKEILDGGVTEVATRVHDPIANDTLVEIKDNGITATPSGLSTAGLITQVSLNSSTWTALPITALTNRNGIGVQNSSSIQIKLNFDNSEPGYVGWSINAQGETFLDIRDTVIVYAKSQSGTPTVTIMEVS